MSREFQDTIVAVATPRGEGALAIVRLSGPEAGALLAAVAPALGGELPAERRASLVSIVDPDSGDEVDRVLATYYRGPRSFTGEDMVEVSCHGGRLTPLMVQAAFEAAGARPAAPGEFTRRAYVEGKVDLVQAEAIGDLVSARNRALHRAALRQLDGGLSQRVDALRRELIEVEVLLSHHLDFPEEDDAPVPLERVIARARALGAGLERLEATAPEGELLRSGALVVLAGRPNAGKSSLFNALIGEQRAIVTEVPGTTRDALEIEVAIGGFPFRLVDTAGLRRTDEAVERLGIEVAHRFLAAASAIVFLVEAGRDLAEDEIEAVRGWRQAGSRVLIVRSKADRTEAPASAAAGSGGDDEHLPVSAMTGVGLDALRHRLLTLVYRELSVMDEAPILTNARQRTAVSIGRREVQEFADALESGVPAEVAAAHVRAAEGALEAMLGTVSSEDVLDALFRSFCIGK